LSAADATRGEILVSTPSGAILDADFHTACGGATLSGVRDSDKPLPALTSAQTARKILALPPAGLLCEPGDSTEWASVKWAVFLDAEAIERRLSANGDFGRLKAVAITKRDAAGRALEARFTGTKREYPVSGSDAIVRALSGGALRSPLFYITPFYDGARIAKLLVRGLGTGSGAGMCMHGADTLAAGGADYKTLLLKYFPQSALSIQK
jgi:SpoIID/LytB domain protein